MILRAAAADQPTNLRIGRELGCSNLTVGTWRRRSLALGLAGLQDARRSGRPQAIAASTQVHVLSVASTLPQDHERTVTRWTLDELAATVLDARHTDALSRSSIWRILQAVDLNPYKSAYWLNSHDEDFDTKAQTICHLYAKALEAYQHGRRVICCDEKTGRPILERAAPTTPAQAGRRERREHADIRHSTRVLSNSLAVATGHMVWSIGPTRTATDFVAHLHQAQPCLPRMEH
jgi:transposase